MYVIVTTHSQQRIAFTARGPRASAVRYAIRYWECVVSRLLKNNPPRECEGIESQVDASAGFSSYDHGKSFQTFSTRQRQRGHPTDQQAVPTLISKMMTLRTSVMSLCPRIPRLTWRSVCDFSRAGGRPEACALQATKCLQTFCWWTITLWSQSGSAQKHAGSMVSRIQPRLCSTMWWESSGIFGSRKRTRPT